MENVEINLEKMEIESSVSISKTYKELEVYYRGNDKMLNVTFPLMILSEPSSVHKKRFVGEEAGLYFYVNYPWTISLTNIKEKENE